MLRVFSAVVALLLSVGAGVAEQARTQAVGMQGPAGAAFYDPPSPLPPGRRGSVIWTRPLDGTMALPSAARNALVLYRSMDAKDRTVAVSGTVSIPPGEAPKGGWPVITWTHGTTGLARGCAPSLDNANGPEHPYIDIIRMLLDGFVKKGYAVVATDYQGLGTPGPHPFLQGIPTARNALDMLRAARAIEPGIGRRYAVVGHSQGGQVDLFAASLGPSYVPEFRLVGNVAFAPASGIADRLKMVMASPKNELSLPYLLYTLESFATADRSVDLKRILTPQALSHLPDLMKGCMTHALSAGFWSTAVAKDQFVAKPDLSAFLRVAARNEPGRLKIAAPTLIVQGLDDVTVFPSATDVTARQLCNNGTVLEYRLIPGADHNGSMQRGGNLALEWIEARFAGKMTAGNCKALPNSSSKDPAKGRAP